AVQNAALGGERRRSFCQVGAYGGMNVLCLLWSSHLAGANRPDGLVSDHSEARSAGQGLSDGVELAAHHGQSCAVLALLEGLAHTNARSQTTILRDPRLVTNQLIGL